MTTETNPFDKAGRHLIKRDAAGFFRWLLRRDDVSFYRWIDTRRVVLPRQGDLTNDLVASFRLGAGYEALIVELQSEARSSTLLRLLQYLATLCAEPAEEDSLPLIAAGGVALNLTGSSESRELKMNPTVAPACSLAFSVFPRDLGRDDAAGLLAGIEAGRTSVWQLGWAPLMQGGSEAAIIERWKELANGLPDEEQRGTLGLSALTFAGLTEHRTVWETALRGWNMQTSPLWDEIRADGWRDGARRTILKLGRQHFGKAATKKQQAELARIADIDRLDRILDHLLSATSWTDLLATP